MLIFPESKASLSPFLKCRDPWDEIYTLHNQDAVLTTPASEMVQSGVKRGRHFSIEGIVHRRIKIIYSYSCL